MGTTNAVLLGAGIAAAGAAVLTLYFDLRRGRAQHQKELRERLRGQLRSILAFCVAFTNHVNAKGLTHTEALSTSKVQTAMKELEDIRQDGLISPNGPHIDAVYSLLSEMWVLIPLIDPSERFEVPMTEEQYGKWFRNNIARLLHASIGLEIYVDKYLTALGKMDRAGLTGYLVFQRYRFFKPKNEKPGGLEEILEE